MHEVRDLSRGDLRFRVRHTRGGGTGPTYLLIHGIGVSHRYFARLHDVLARTGPVVSVDLPGFGGLPKPATSPDITEMAEALASVLREVEGAPFVAVGHSMGSQWVTELALAAPDLVSHVVLAGPVADARHRTPLAQASALALDTLREVPSGNAIVLTDYLRCGPVWYTRQLRPMLTYPIEDRVRLLTQPVLVLRGAWDPVAGRQWCRWLADAAGGALVEVPRAPHLVQHVGARAVAGALAAFVAGEVPARLRGRA